MKKPVMNIMVGLTAAFFTFVLGLFVGRNYLRTPVQVSVPEELLTRPTASSAETFGEDRLFETTEAAFPIDINTAQVHELMALPGIGEVIAKRIVGYREAAGGFSSVEELLNVEGIGEKRLEEMLDYVTVGGSK